MKNNTVRAIFFIVLIAFALAAIKVLTSVFMIVQKQGVPGFSYASKPSLITQQNPAGQKTVIEKLEKEKDSANPYAGERIAYSISMGGLGVGKAWFSQMENTVLNGRPVFVMSMQTKLNTRFRDTEIIFSDPKTLLPIRVERNVVTMFKREKIAEDYDQKNFTVTITKQAGKHTEKIVITKESVIHNAILLPHVVRKMDDLSTGKTIIANLPGRTVEIKLDSIEDVDVPAGTFKSYHFISNPKQIEFWISADGQKIPLKIKSTGAFAYTMKMQEYTPATSPNVSKNTTRDHVLQ
ncbi:MAG: DUF3108 domain-containing protein [Candidatus Omnitrophica bacterium]|nr:DUF3108 domain-containing protein [Candidatus Omnitrophota bacterium]